MSTGYSLLGGSPPVALQAGVAPSHVELAGVKQWWGADIAEISVDVASSSWPWWSPHPSIRVVCCFWPLGPLGSILRLTMKCASGVVTEVDIDYCSIYTHDICKYNTLQIIGFSVTGAFLFHLLPTQTHWGCQYRRWDSWEISSPWMLWSLLWADL